MKAKRYVTIIFLCLLSGVSNADIKVPSCEKLEKFPIDYVVYGRYNQILNEYFEKPLIDWTDSDFKTFIMSFENCRDKNDKFTTYTNKSYLMAAVNKVAKDLNKLIPKEKSKKQAQEEMDKLKIECENLAEKAKALKITEQELSRLKEIKKEASDILYKSGHEVSNTDVSELVNYTLMKHEDDLAEKKQREEQELEEAQRSKELKIKHEKELREANELVAKHGNIGPTSDFLTSQFQTYAGAATSGNLCTVIKFYDSLNGKNKWKKVDNAWVINQKFKDNLTGVKHELYYAFHDLRAQQGYVWLERVVVDKQEYPSSQLAYLVLQVIRH